MPQRPFRNETVTLEQLTDDTWKVTQVRRPSRSDEEMRKWTELLRERTTKYLESFDEVSPEEKDLAFFNVPAAEDKFRVVLNIGTVIDGATFENISKASA